MFNKYFSDNVRTSLMYENLNMAREIRLRLNKYIHIYYDDEKIIKYKVTKNDINEIFSRLCQYSPYAYLEDIKRGFLTMENGCRVGICGKTVDDYNMKDITSLNIRVAKQFKGCSDSIINKIKGNLIIASPPACGKTTILRDIIRSLSNSGKNIGVVDERGEIYGNCFDLGERTDVLLACAKPRGMEMLLRTMSPDIIAVDELGGNEDIKAAFDIIHCGVGLIATIHSSTVDEVKYRLKELYSEFDTKIFLKGVGQIDKILEV